MASDIEIVINEVGAYMRAPIMAFGFFAVIWLLI